jgi:pimeloyl-ACP methyl ester carboxylesterase
LALFRPRLIRRLVLAGTAPEGAPKIHRWSDDVYALATQDVPDPERFIRLFFSGSEDSRTKGMEYFKRISARTVDHDEPTDLATRDAQLDAISRWGIPDPSKLARLAAITQPTLVANGDNDTMMITENSYLLAHHLPSSSPTTSTRSSAAAIRGSRYVIHPEQGGRMATLHFNQTTTLTPEQYIAGLTDFGPGRSKLFGNSADDYLEVYSQSPTEADVKEGSAASGSACTNQHMP